MLLRRPAGACDQWPAGAYGQWPPRACGRWPGLGQRDSTARDRRGSSTAASGAGGTPGRPGDSRRAGGMVPGPVRGLGDTKPPAGTSCCYGNR